MAGLVAAACAVPLLPAARPAVAADLPTWSFDFGTADSPVADGFSRVSPGTAYDETAGFGITGGDGLAARDRSTVSDAMEGDFVLGGEWQFGVDVPDGTYDVQVWAGDTLTGTSSVRTTVGLEGVTAGHVRPEKEQVASESFTTSVVDGQLTVDVTGLGYGYVNGIVVTQTSDVPTGVVPQDVRVAAAEDGALTMRWDEVPGAQGYVLSRSESVDGEYTEVARTGEREFYATDSGIDTTVPHYYRVRAVTGSGASEASRPAVGSLVGDGVDEPALAAGESLDLDLGSGDVADGAVGLDETSAYDAESRLGFVDTAAVTATDRGTGDAVGSDFVTVGDTDLVADLPNGDYKVSVLAGDPEGTTDIAVTAEQMAKVERTAVVAGDQLSTDFEIALVDGQLNLQIGGTAPNLAGLTITRLAERAAGTEPTVYVAGDSTVQTYDDYWAPQQGWGQTIDRYLSDDVTVDNQAIGGRSSKNFISQGRLDAMLRTIRPGDYMLVQFGHNDASFGVDDRFAAPGDYYHYLDTFVEGVRQRGATPIVVTPVSRRSFDPDTGKFNVSFPEYVDAATQRAQDSDALLVDLSASSRAYLDEIGPEAALDVFLHVDPGEYPNRPDGTADDTHFQEYGAIQMARLVATDLAGLDTPLAEEVVDLDAPVE